MTKQEAIGVTDSKCKISDDSACRCKEWTGGKAQALYRSDEVFDGAFNNNYMWTCIVYDRICII